MSKYEFRTSQNKRSSNKNISDGARASYFRTGSSEKRRHCARARTLWTFCQGDLGHPSSSPPLGLCAPSARRQTQPREILLFFFSFLFVTNRLGRDMRCRREIIYYYYVVPFPTPDRPSNISNKRAREYLTNNLIFLLQIGTNQTDSV